LGRKESPEKRGDVELGLFGKKRKKGEFLTAPDKVEKRVILGRKRGHSGKERNLNLHYQIEEKRWSGDSIRVVLSITGLR